MRIVISGASHGIGAAIAERFVRQGFKAMLVARNAEQLEVAAAHIRKQVPSGEVLTVAADLAHTEGAGAVAQAVRQHWGGVDVLVNNAGVFVPGQVLQEPAGTLESQLGSNLHSAYHLTRALHPLLAKQGKRHIFNMCSVASIKAYPNGGSYSISKWALLGFSEVLREELKEEGVRVTAMVPGATWTRSWASSGLPAERFMLPEDIAELMWSAYTVSEGAVVEEIRLRPLAGDI